MSWLKRLFGTEETDVVVKKIQEKSIPDGVMASSYMAGAVAQLGGVTKVLMVHNTTYEESVTEYAFKLAGKLNCDIIALDVTDKPLEFKGERQVREVARFKDTVNASYKNFSMKATALGIKVKHEVVLGNQQETIGKFSQEDKGIRYVLSAPELKQEELRQSNYVPVYDLRCSRLRAEER